MARYFRQVLSTAEALPRAPAGPLLGKEIARRAPVVAAMRAQDRVVATSRRVVLQVGKSGATEWMVPNVDPVQVALGAQTHPIRDSRRTVARSQFRLTPGCMLSLRALVSLSGQTQVNDSPNTPAWIAGGCQGVIRLTSTFDDGGTPVVRVSEVVLPNSGELYGAAPTNAGGAFAAMRTVRIPLITPQPINTVVRERRWSQPTVVTLQLEYVGGARVHSCVVSEVPHVVAMESDDASDRWCSHVLGSTPGGQAPLVGYPFQRLSEVSPDGDDRGGSWKLADVANAQAQRLGPTLLRWTSYDEDDEVVTISEAAPRIAVSTSLVALANASIVTYNAANEGHGVAAGSYARTRDVSDPAALPNNGVVPIRLRAYCRGSDGTTNSGGILRLQTSAHEWIELTIASGAAAGWYSIVGHARVGAGPGDAAVGQLLFRRTTASGGFSVWAVCVEYDRTVDP